MLKILIFLDNFIAKLERKIIILLILAMIFILFAQVILRYFFSNPIFWAEDVAVQLLAAITCIGVSYLIYKNEMVKVDFLLLLLPQSMLSFTQKAIYLIGFITLSIICWYADDWIIRPENQVAISPTTGFLKWYNYLFMITCFHLMTLHLFVKMLSTIESANQIEED
ncbi:Neu5Ac permease [Gallibacterium anatis]|uniref:TRAP transporter small permease protein n=1 Tax=Gallibacterium anatis TaxID=750 RepID=A0A377H3S7_9PAST|nr:TRAP transporter small permease [Gallibacterium anatis]STO37171.1 Neu5Ac permease [Gallibacterium anatis]